MRRFGSFSHLWKSATEAWQRQSRGRRLAVVVQSDLEANLKNLMRIDRKVKCCICKGFTLYLSLLLLLLQIFIYFIIYYIIAWGFYHLTLSYFLQLTLIINAEVSWSEFMLQFSLFPLNSSSSSTKCFKAPLDTNAQFVTSFDVCCLLASRGGKKCRPDCSRAHVSLLEANYLRLFLHFASSHRSENGASRETKSSPHNV